jgi:hypothetical protein
MGIAAKYNAMRYILTPFVQRLIDRSTGKVRST